MVLYTLIYRYRLDSNSSKDFPLVSGNTLSMIKKPINAKPTMILAIKSISYEIANADNSAEIAFKKTS